MSWLFVLSLLGAAIGLFVYERDYIAAGVLGVVGLAALSGHRVGASGIVGLVLGVAAAIQFAEPVGRMLEPQLDSLLHRDGLVGRWCGIGLAGFIVAFTVLFAIKLAAYVSTTRRPAWRAWDRRCGFVIGALQGGGLALLLVSGILAVEPIARQRLETAEPGVAQVPGRMVALAVTQAGVWTRGSVVGSVAKRFNPFEQVPTLKSLLQGLLVANDPAALRELEQHSSLAEFKNRDNVQAATRRLQQDPQVHKLVESGQALDPSALKSLLENPAVLRFCDETGLLQELARILPSLNLSSQALPTNSRPAVRQ